MQAVILAGGKGTRLAERLRGLPKPLIEVCGVPLLERQLDTLEKNGVTEALVLVNHAADQIEAFFASRPSAIKVTLVDDGAPRGTAGAVLACLDLLAERFAVVYGDTLFDLDVAGMLNRHLRRGDAATLLLHPNDHPADSDLVELGHDDVVRGFHSYPHPPGAELNNLVNAAFYIVERSALEPWRQFAVPSDFAKDLFPAMLAKGQTLGGYVSHEYIKDLGTPRRLDQVERHLASGVVARARRLAPQRIIFLDRDGTLNKPAGHVAEPARLDLLPGAARAVRRFNDAEMRTVMVTNQPVLARGDCTPEGLDRIHARLSSLLGAEGAYLDRIEICPHHPDSGFAGEVADLKMRCDCRKPGTLMLERALAALNGDRARCWMIGDSSADMLAANRAGLLSVLVQTGEHAGRDARHPGLPDFTEPDLEAAARTVLDVFPRLAEIAAPIAAGIRPGDAVLVGGLARAGKSGFAAALRQALQLRGLTPLSVPLDRWLRGAVDRGAGLEGRYDGEAAHAFFAPWFAGGELDGVPPFYDRFTRIAAPGDRVTLASDGIVILEGVPALRMAWSGRRVHRIAVTTDEGARARRVRENLCRRGASRHEAERIYDERQADEAALVIPSLADADHTVNLDAVWNDFSA